jgi:hypothetical protein
MASLVGRAIFILFRVTIMPIQEMWVPLLMDPSSLEFSTPERFPVLDLSRGIHAMKSFVNRQFKRLSPGLCRNCSSRKEIKWLFDL